MPGRGVWMQKYPWVQCWLTDCPVQPAQFIASKLFRHHSLTPSLSAGGSWAEVFLLVSCLLSSILLCTIAATPCWGDDRKWQKMTNNNNPSLSELSATTSYTGLVCSLNCREYCLRSQLNKDSPDEGSWRMEGWRLSNRRTRTRSSASSNATHHQHPVTEYSSLSLDFEHYYYTALNWHKYEVCFT